MNRALEPALYRRARRARHNSLQALRRSGIRSRVLKRTAMLRERISVTAFLRELIVSAKRHSLFH